MHDAPHSPISRLSATWWAWLLLGTWVLISLGGLFYFEYQDAWRGLLCLAGRAP